MDTMQGQGTGLLSQIEQDVLDDGKPLGTALRKCMLMGSRTGSSQLREWATLELKGYPIRGEVPEYRVVHAGLHIDGVTSGGIIKGQPIGSSWLPDFVAEHVSERLELTQAVYELSERQPVPAYTGSLLVGSSQCYKRCPRAG